MKNNTKYSALITSSLLIVALAGPANAAPPETHVPTTGSQDVINQNTEKVSAANTVAISYEKPAISTTPAPAVEAPVTPQIQSVPVAAVAATEVAPQTRTPKHRAETPTPSTAPAAGLELQPVAAPVSASGKGAAIAAAAYAQLGVAQDCTMLATNSLAAVGIRFHGWPAGYLTLGTVIPASQAQPGDLAYYANGGSGLAHIAVYVGGGKAVHGGWNGGTTSLQSVNVGSGPVFIRVA